MNENFLQSLEDKCHRMLNAVEPGTAVAIHRRVAKDECFVVLRGKVGVTTHDDDGGVIEDVGVRQERGNYGAMFQDKSVLELLGLTHTEIETILVKQNN